MFGRLSNHPRQNEQNFALCCISLLHFLVALLPCFRGSVLWLRGGLHMCKGSSLCCSSFGLVVCTLCLSMVLSQLCRAVALA
jgi:hypothetical protein